MDNKGKKSTGHRAVVLAAVMLIIGMIAIHLLSVHYALASTEKLRVSTLGYVKEKLETYDNYCANDRTKSLVRLLIRHW